MLNEERATGQPAGMHNLIASGGGTQKEIHILNKFQYRSSQVRASFVRGLMIAVYRLQVPKTRTRNVYAHLTCAFFRISYAFD